MTTATAKKGGKTKPVNKYPTEGFASVLQAAEFLGMSRHSVYRLIAAGKLNKAAFNTPVRIAWSELHGQAGVKKP